MKFPAIRRVLLFGGAPLLLRSARRLKAEGFTVVVFTAPRHAEERIGERGESLADALTSQGIPVTITDDINACAELLPHITPDALGIGMGEAWSFSPAIIEKFGGRLLDFMGIPLPRYRGGAHYTWMILSGSRQMACNLQVINEHMVQGVFDSGEIVETLNYELPASVRTPQDYFDGALPVEVDFIVDFIRRASKGAEFKPYLPDEAKSLYFPRLLTKTHGWVDWSWRGRDIETFLRAFDAPYIGAGSSLGGVDVRLTGARFVSDERFHPFQSGLVVRVRAEGGAAIPTVATTDGLLEIASVRRDDGTVVGDIPTGARFITAPDRLANALAASVTFSASGSVVTNK